MKIEQIAFRFQRDELQVLIKLLRIGFLPGTESDPEADEKHALQGLIEDGIVQVAGSETMLVDRAVSLTLLNASAYEQCIIVESECNRMILFKGKLFDVILCTDEGMSILCPVKEWKLACQQFLQEVVHIQPIRFAVLEKGADLNWENVPQVGLKEFLEQKMSLHIG